MLLVFSLKAKLLDLEMTNVCCVYPGNKLKVTMNLAKGSLHESVAVILIGVYGEEAIVVLFKIYRPCHASV